MLSQPWRRQPHFSPAAGKKQRKTGLLLHGAPGAGYLYPETQLPGQRVRGGGVEIENGFAAGVVAGKEFNPLCLCFLLEKRPQFPDQLILGGRIKLPLHPLGPPHGKAEILPEEWFQRP